MASEEEIREQLAEVAKMKKEVEQKIRVDTGGPRNWETEQMYENRMERLTNYGKWIRDLDVEAARLQEQLKGF